MKLVKASVMEIYDLQTQVGKGTVLKVHTPTGNNVKRHLLGHFLQYKQFKYLGARVTLIPASTLPADPLQLSYDAGDANIDPRDMVNPILWKHYHGETMLTDILKSNPEQSYDQEQNIDVLPGSALDSQIYNQIGEASNQMDRVYPKTLMDTSFRKAGIQQGFSTFVKPYAYNVVSPVQLLPREVPVTPGSTRYRMMGYNDVLGVGLEGSYPVQTSSGKLTGSAVMKYANDNSLVYGMEPNLTLCTNKLTPVGWMDTLSRESVAPGTAITGTNAITANVPNGNPVSGDFALCPNLAAYPMLYVLMPPAYKTEFYFRLIIKHFYAFRGFRSCFSVQSIPSAGIWTNLPAPGNYDPTPASVSSMVADLEGDDSTNTVEVENGTLLTMADGAEGDS
uniref:Capsid protein n=1 Tax=Porcine associated porprismacovirus TaxID=2496634 RepID=A0A482JVA6_9VIRU|nr:capsid protein [Porcine associated porprismacovirus]